MTGFQTMRLADFCKTGSGSTPSRSQMDRYYESGSIPWVKSGELREGIITSTEEHVTTTALKETSVKLVPSGAILLAMYGATVGRLAILGVEATTNQAVCHIVPDPKIADTRYLYYAIANQVPSIIAMGVGGAQPNINQGIVKDLVIRIQPIQEQRRIAAILDQADALRAKRREALAQLDSLTLSIFVEMFGDVEGNDWAISSVADIADASKGSIRTGPFGSQLLHSEFVKEGVVVLGIDNAVHNEFRWRGRRFISPEKYRELKRYTVQPGDVLITIMGTCGRCAVVPADIPAAINTKHICCITLDTKKCLPGFLHAYFLMHPIARKYLAQTAKGAIMDGLNMGIIKAMPVPLVPMDLQRKFEVRLKSLQKTKSANIAAATELDTLFASLQHQAFNGKL